MKICTAFICGRSFYTGVCKRQSIPAAGKSSVGGHVLEIIKMPELLQGKEQTCLLNSWIKGSTKGLEQWLPTVGEAEEWWGRCLPSSCLSLQFNNCQTEPLLPTGIDQAKCNRKTDQEYWARAVFLLLGLVSSQNLRVLRISARKMKVATLIDPGQVNPTKSQIKP